MKTLIFSDTHLTDRFEVGKFEFLEKIIEPVDRVVIAGDFWDSFLCSFERFVNSEWKKLFPPLKAKKTIYLHGNHDPAESIDGRAALFSDEQQECYLFSSGRKNFKVLHGHTLHPSVESKMPWLKDIKILVWIGERLEWLGVRMGSWMFFKTFYGSQNAATKEIIKAEGIGEIVVAGHTHHPEIDLASSYINSGLIRHRHASYVIIENGKIDLVKDTY